MNAASTSAKAAGSRSMSAMVLATSSRVMRNHSFRVADRGQPSRPSRMEPSGQMPSRILAITPDLSLLKTVAKPDNGANPLEADRNQTEEKDCSESCHSHSSESMRVTLILYPNNRSGQDSTQAASSSWNKSFSMP